MYQVQEAKLGLSLLDCYWLVGKECRRLVGNVSGDWQNGVFFRISVLVSACSLHSHVFTA